MSQTLDRRRFLAASLATTSLGLRSTNAQQPAAPKIEQGIAWHDVRQWGVEGKGWDETSRWFDRLPAKAENMVRPAVWNLSRHSAGMLTRFETNAATIHARYRLLTSRLAMSHMPATGVSGLDLYARDQQGRDRWLAVVRPAAQQVKTVVVSDVDPLPGKAARRYTTYLPLYNGVESLEIGIPAGSEFKGIMPRTEKPIVFYGTSIMHGACASRPGMSISAIVGRRLNKPVINLGFSGNGRMEIEVGQLLAELDPCVYAIDCLPNMRAAEISERTAPLVRQLRSVRPDTPILMVEDRTYTYAAFRRSARERHRSSRAAFRTAYDQLKQDGVQGLHYLEGKGILGDDAEAATDGSHPNDLGMMRYADAYVTKLGSIL